MATTITTTLPDIMLTSSIPDIYFTSDESQVNVSVTVNGVDVFSETYYTFRRYVQMHDLGEIVENAMRSSFSPLAECELRANDQSMRFTALLCLREGPMSCLSMLQQNFLTSRKTKVLPPDSVDLLHCIVLDREHRLLKIDIYFRQDGKPDVQHLFTVEEPSDRFNDGYSHFIKTVSTFQLLDLLAQKYPMHRDFELLYATYRINDRSFTYYFSKERTDYSLYFLNVYGCLELVSFNATTKAKTKVTKQTAFSNRQMSFYDETLEKTYDVEIANLASEDAEWLEEVFISPDVGMPSRPITAEDDEFDTFDRILITDCTCEAQDGDTELNKVKFSWRRSSQRLPASFTDLSFYRIHTAPFNHPFT